MKLYIVEIFLCTAFLVFFSLLINWLFGVRCNLNWGFQCSSCVLCFSELLATVHMSEPDTESGSIKEAEGIPGTASINVRRELWWEESLQDSDINLKVGLWLLLMQEHMGVSWISSPSLMPADCCDIFSEFRWVYPCPPWCASGKQQGWEPKRTQSPVPLV